MADQGSGFLNRFFGIVIFTETSLYAIMNIMLIIPIFKLQKTNSNAKILYFQFLLSFLIFSLATNLLYVMQFGIILHCDVIGILYHLSGPNLSFSIFSLIIHSFLVLTNNYFFIKRRYLMISTMIIITWLPSIIYLIIYLIFRDPDKFCMVSLEGYDKALLIINNSFEILTVILCVILLIKVCKLNVQNDKDLQISKKKTLSKLVTYVIALIIGIVLKLFAFVIFSYQPVLVIITFLFFMSLNYIFVWSKQFQEAFLDVYCCKKKEDSEENVNQSNQNELIYQQDFNVEEDPNNSRNEE